LNPAEQERVQVELRKIREELGSQVLVAQALDVTQQTVSRVLSGFPPGIPLAEKVASHRKMDVDVFLGRKGGPVSRVEYDRPGRGSSWGELPGWAEAEAEARRKFARLMMPERAWAGAREMHGSKRPHVSPEMVKEAAQFWLEYIDDDAPGR
jgi:hypothetical protein